MIRGYVLRIIKSGLGIRAPAPQGVEPCPGRQICDKICMCGGEGIRDDEILIQDQGLGIMD